MTEAFLEPQKALNEERRRFGLKDLKPPFYNDFFRLDKFEQFIECSQLFEAKERKYYGLYLYLTRAVYPTIIYPEEPKHNNVMSKIAYEYSLGPYSPELDKYSYQIFYALKKI